MMNIKAEIEAMQIQGFSRSAIIKELKKKGYNDVEIREGYSQEIEGEYKEFKGTKTKARLLGLAITIPSVLVIIYAVHVCNWNFRLMGLMLVLIMMGIMIMVTGYLPGYNLKERERSIDFDRKLYDKIRKARRDNEDGAL